MHSPPASDLADRKRACRNAAVKARAWAHGLAGTTSGAKPAAGGLDFLGLGPGLAVSDVWSIPVPVNSAPERILTEHGAKRPVAGLGRSCG